MLEVRVYTSACVVLARDHPRHQRLDRRPLHRLIAEARERIASIEYAGGKRIFKAELPFEAGSGTRVGEDAHATRRHVADKLFEVLGQEAMSALQFQDAIHAAMTGIATGKLLECDAGIEQDPGVSQPRGRYSGV